MAFAWLCCGDGPGRRDRYRACAVAPQHAAKDYASRLYLYGEAEGSLLLSPFLHSTAQFTAPTPRQGECVSCLIADTSQILSENSPPGRSFISSTSKLESETTIHFPSAYRPQQWVPPHHASSPSPFDDTQGSSRYTRGPASLLCSELEGRCAAASPRISPSSGPAVFVWRRPRLCRRLYRTSASQGAAGSCVYRASGKRNHSREKGCG